MDQKPKPQAFLLNLNTRTIHDANSKNGRCKLQLVLEGNKIVFSSFEEAKTFLPEGKKVAKPCAFCLGNDYES